MSEMSVADVGTSIVLTGDLRSAIIAAVAEEGAEVRSVHAIYGGANWIVVVISGPSGATLMSIGPADPLWEVLFEMLRGPAGGGEPTDLSDLVVRITQNCEGDFEALGNHGRARLVLEEGDEYVEELREVLARHPDQDDPSP